jgi:hypothetical protein
VLDKRFVTVGIEVPIIRVNEVKEGAGTAKVKCKNNGFCDAHRRPPLEASTAILNLTVGYDPSFVKRHMF